MVQKGREHEWFDYYEQFGMSPDAIRDGSHPQIMEHPDNTGKAIVLIHGLTDSPYFMRSIADFFFNQLGYNVYLPLLKGHGLKHPKGMIRVRLKDWNANINFALEKACKHAKLVSIGGLSAGGALSFYAAATNNRVTGSLYLFSAALDIAGGIGGVFGEISERILRTPIARLLYWLDKNKPLINTNPYRYARMDKGGAIQLSRLIKRTDRIMKRYHKENKRFPKRVFAAHTKGDHAADIMGIMALKEIADPAKFTLFKVPKEVRHASVVLKEPIYAESIEDHDAPLEQANPVFDKMMEALTAFEKEDSLTQVE